MNASARPASAVWPFVAITVAWSWLFSLPAVLLLLLLPGITVLTAWVMTLLGEPLWMERAMPLELVVPVFLLIYLLHALPEEYGPVW
jgi:hypothetical protein